MERLQEKKGVELASLRITLEGSLLLSSDEAGGLGVDQATARRRIAGLEVPYIPATALRGAIRIQLEALLRGDSQAVTGPYFGDERTATTPEPRDLVATLFGYSGPVDERIGSLEGKVRIGDALPECAAIAASRLAARAGVAIDPSTGGAADKKLYFRQVVEASKDPLVFVAELEATDLIPAENRALRAAVATTRAIGGSRSAGSGAIEIEWLGSEASGGLRVEGNPETATRARVEITLREPCHFGDGGPLGNYQGTRTHIPGSTLRGALGWSLARSGQTETEAFKRLFLGDVSFGEALWTPDLVIDPRVVPVTTSRDRASGRLADRLAEELARIRLNEEIGPSKRYLRVDRGSARLDPIPPRPDGGLVKLTRTRVSIDRASGTAATSRLFSIEQIEPWTLEDQPATFIAWIEGLDPARPELARLLAELEGCRVYLGSGRHRGQGLVEITLRFCEEPSRVDAAREALAVLDAAANSKVESVAELVAPAPRRRQSLPLALVAVSDYLPSSPTHHPLAELGADFPAPRRAFLESAQLGGYDEHPQRSSALRDLAPAIAAGSVFVYEAPHSLIEESLPAWLPALRRGVGRSTTAGCGRFTVFETPSDQEGVADSQEERSMRSQLSPALKRDLVTRAEELAAKADRPQGREISQLRNLVQVAQQESEVAVLVNFIRYQAVRKATEAFWRPLHAGVCAALEEFGKHPDLAEDAERRRIAFQHFFGYLVRAYLYRAEVSRSRPPAPPALSKAPSGGQR